MNRLSSLLDKISGFVVNLVFKFAILICIAIFLFLYYRSTENNRYQYIKSDEPNIIFEVFDTKTGLTYTWFSPNKEKNERAVWNVIDPISGTVKAKESK